jgi:hypothetical protein
LRTTGLNKTLPILLIDINKFVTCLLINSNSYEVNMTEPLYTRVNNRFKIFLFLLGCKYDIDFSNLNEWLRLIYTICGSVSLVFLALTLFFYATLPDLSTFHGKIGKIIVKGELKETRTNYDFFTIWFCFDLLLTKPNLFKVFRKLYTKITMVVFNSPMQFSENEVRVNFSNFGSPYPKSPSKMNSKI